MQGWLRLDFRPWSSWHILDVRLDLWLYHSGSGKSSRVFANSVRPDYDYNPATLLESSIYPNGPYWWMRHLDFTTAGLSYAGGGAGMKSFDVSPAAVLREGLRLGVVVESGHPSSELYLFGPSTAGTGDTAYGAHGDTYKLFRSISH